ncbi:2',3'-cyclic-nucleotide 2'-phosphodiesterase/5'-or 3'-nucleotidase, 5'-nucleotidase family [Selenomonas sp. WCT3]|uniref:bifunctional metallophosphatase/5'-nucleotidase n=1 Tax=Selenomonas sp. WCT3 TaxID=3158785 RepID=UPI000882AD43|nr:2',3'-cyclic-nucleotide 2'-phosphodiesterase/5'-or 3'-nucleotidase, 5'-nucleotidase family [Selenomonas ruminantium]
MKTMPIRWSHFLMAMVLSAALLLPVPAVASVQKDGVHITIFHTNDMHGRVLESDDNGKAIGMKWIAAAIWQQKEADADTLAFDAGDTLHGMPIINASKGENMARLMNLSGYDGMTPGNHDFNYGAVQLQKLAGMLNFPMLSANLVDRDEQGYVFRPYKSFELNGVRIAVFGLSTPETAYKTNKVNVELVKFLNPVDTAKKLVPKLRKNHDVVIGLMHMGLDASSEYTSARIAKEVPGIDLILDGHSHTKLQKPEKVGKTLICQTGAQGDFLGRVELIVRNHKLRKVKSVLLDRAAIVNEVEGPDEGVSEALQAIEADNQKTVGKVVTQSPRELSSARELVRTRESELGNLTADALRWAAQADIGLANGGGLRANLPAGAVTQGDLWKIFPFGNTLKRVEISGATVQKVLEHSVEYVPGAFGGFMDVSGLTFTLDIAAPAGSRVSNVKVAGEPLDNQRLYQVAVSDFTAAGGDGYDMLKNAKVTGEFGTLEEVFSQYLNQKGIGDIATGRIQIKK